MNYTLYENLNLKPYTQILIGGSVHYALLPHNKEGIVECFELLQKQLKSPFFILSGGANSVLQDDLSEYTVILTHHLNHYKVSNNKVIVQAGVPMMHLSEQLLKTYQLKGFEWAYGLPGFIGGGLFMNARVYEKQFEDIVEWVEVFDYKNHQFKILSLEECQYAYKQSIFQHEPYFIYQASLMMSPISDGEHSILMESIDAKRDRILKGQYLYPSAGSLFKNTYYDGVSTGALLDDMGLKGYSNSLYPDVKISEKHANFFVNATGKATYAQMQGLVEDIQKRVYENKGFMLELEVQFLPYEL